LDDKKKKNDENLEPEEVEENENPDATDIEEPEEHEEADDNEEVVEGEEPKEVKEESVPLATFLSEKKKRKALETKLAEKEDAEFDNSIKAKKAIIKKQWLDNGFDEPTATAAAEMAATIYSDFGTLRQSKKDMILDTQIDELSTDNFYSDIKNYKAQIKSKIKSFSKAGETLSVEEAYLMVVGPHTKMREAKIDQEVKKAANSSNKGTSSKKSNVATSSGSSTKSTKLSPEDAKNLKTLQKIQPDFEWTAEKYLKRINS
jgi:hypothetical protein